MDIKDIGVNLVRKITIEVETNVILTPDMIQNKIESILRAPATMAFNQAAMLKVNSVKVELPDVW